MELSLQYLRLKLYAMIEAILDLTAKPIGERKVCATKPMKIATSGAARAAHAVVESVCRRVAAREKMLFPVVSSAVFATSIPARIWSHIIFFSLIASVFML